MPRWSDLKVNFNVLMIYNAISTFFIIILASSI